jgi:hypothetical protein
VPKFKKTLLLLGVLAGLVIVIVLVNFIRTKMAASSDRLFSAYQPAKATEFIVQAQWNSTKLVRTAGGWVVPAADSFPADTTDLRTILAACDSMSAQDMVSTNPEKHTVFQVDSAAGTRAVVVAGKDTVVSVVIGKNGPDYNSIYFRPAASKNVYQYPQNIKYLFGKNNSTWRDTYVLRLDREQITGLTLNYPGQMVVLSRKDDGSWKLSKPQDAEAKQNLVNEIINTVSALTSKDMQRPAPAPADSLYGFGRPQCTVTIITKSSGAFTLTVGAFNGQDKDYFAKSSSRSFVYKINDYQANTIMKQFEELKEDIPAAKPDSAFPQQ